MISLSHKDYKIHNKEVIKLQFPSTTNEDVLYTKIRSLKEPSTLIKEK